MVSCRLSRRLLSASLLILLAGCSSLGIKGNKAEAPPAPESTNRPMVSTGPSVIDPTTGAQVVQATCPRIYMHDDSVFYRTYAKGAKDDPQQVIYQASIANVTRQCTLNDTNLNITVVAQGRLVAGPVGGPGKVTLPIRITIVDGENVLYSEVSNFQAEIPPGQATAQFLFRKDNIAVPAGGALARVNLGFDTANEKNLAKKKKPGA
ncbi:hypothetical protein [Rhizobium sp. BK251]|uniref:hypothetical protein n=1 Tax=Rhizobium sp. BK251 TaxID=2512125 RepID=UPI001A9F5BDD|nr:hypothetical protein [Rhizobium sp. BK251]